MGAAGVFPMKLILTLQNTSMKTSATLTALLLAPLVALNAAGPAAKPNVVVVLADDLGWGDLSCYPKDPTNPDAAMFTPHLDALARQGTLFTQAYGADHVLPVAGCAADRSLSAAFWV